MSSLDLLDAVFTVTQDVKNVCVMFINNIDSSITEMVNTGFFFFVNVLTSDPFFLPFSGINVIP